MSRHGSFLVGVARHGDLIDQALIGGLKVDQGQRFISLRLLQLLRDFTERNWLGWDPLLIRAGRGRGRILEDFAVGMQDLDRRLDLLAASSAPARF